MAFTDKLLLWLHIAFAIFTIGPVTVTTSFTPRYIRSGDVPVLRFLNRTTRIFGLLTIGVFLFGAVLGRERMAQAWLTISMTLFIVAFALLFALVERDQRKAIQKLLAKQAAEAAAEAAAPAAAESADASEAAEEKAETPGEKAARKVKDTDVRVQTARIASMSGVIALLWLVILVLMVWFA
ncbi:MAG TPA: hypothetical protein VGL93_14640 [Streptosporangiaceae bacterium]|jgi:hypothetical protein